MSQRFQSQVISQGPLKPRDVHSQEISKRPQKPQDVSRDKNPAKDPSPMIEDYSRFGSDHGYVFNGRPVKEQFNLTTPRRPDMLATAVAVASALSSSTEYPCLSGRCSQLRLSSPVERDLHMLRTHRHSDVLLRRTWTSSEREVRKQTIDGQDNRQPWQGGQEQWYRGCATCNRVFSGLTIPPLRTGYMCLVDDTCRTKSRSRAQRDDHMYQSHGFPRGACCRI